MVEIIKETPGLLYCSGIKDGIKIFFQIFRFDHDNKEDFTVEAIENELDDAIISSYANKSLEDYSDEYTTFQLNIHKKLQSELSALNTSIYDYELYFNHKEVEPFFKSAFIILQDDYYYIAVENFDNESMINAKRLAEIENYNYSTLDEVLGKEFSHVECYSY